MGLLQFDKLPVNNLVGADWNTYKEILQGLSWKISSHYCRLPIAIHARTHTRKALPKTFGQPTAEARSRIHFGALAVRNDLCPQCFVLR